MKKNKIILMVSGLVVLFSITALSLSKRNPVDAESYDPNGVRAVAEPTPAVNSISDTVIQKEDVPEPEFSARTKEQLAQKILTQYDWENREDDKRMFHLVLLCTDGWLKDDGWEIQTAAVPESACLAQTKEQIVEDFLAQYRWDGWEEEIYHEVLLRVDDLDAVYVLNPDDEE